MTVYRVGDRADGQADGVGTPGLTPFGGQSRFCLNGVDRVEVEAEMTNDAALALLGGCHPVAKVCGMRNATFSVFRNVRGSAPSRSGFTLIELLVTIAILSVVASMLFPAIGLVRRAAETTTCMSNLRQIGTAIFIYSGDHDGFFPAHRNHNTTSWPHTFGDWGGVDSSRRTNFYRDYLRVNRKVYYCATGIRFQKFTTNDIRLGYENFPGRGAYHVNVINYTYFAGKDEFGGNARCGPINEARATSKSTIIGDLMRFGTSAPYSNNVRTWNHMGRASSPGGVELNEKSGGNLFHGDGHVSWIGGGPANLLANRQRMKGSNDKSYCASQ